MIARLLSPLPLILLGYLCGSISFAYVVARAARSIDLRHYGSRKLSASNVYGYLGFAGMALVGILDIAKTVLPVWISMRLGRTLAVTVLVGLAVMIGHNWSLFLGFVGGRGISAALGLLLCIFPEGVPWLLAWVFAGRLVPHAAAIPALLGFVKLPFLAMWLNQPAATVWGSWGILLITVVKRLESNRQPLPPNERAWRVLLRRLVLDRDIADFEAWSRYTPADANEAGCREYSHRRP